MKKNRMILGLAAAAVMCVGAAGCSQSPAQSQVTEEPSTWVYSSENDAWRFNTEAVGTDTVMYNNGIAAYGPVAWDEVNPGLTPPNATEAPTETITEIEVYGISDGTQNTSTAVANAKNHAENTAANAEGAATTEAAKGADANKTTTAASAAGAAGTMSVKARNAVKTTTKATTAKIADSAAAGTKPTTAANATAAAGAAATDAAIAGLSQDYTLLRQGDNNRLVKVLQDNLQKLGLMDKTTGYFGTETKAAVLDLQKASSIAQDAIVGHDTWTALFTKAAKS